jgi:hypothetical protein
VPSEHARHAVVQGIEPQNVLHALETMRQILKALHVLHFKYSNTGVKSDADVFQTLSEVTS